VQLDLLDETQICWHPYRHAPKWVEDPYELAWVQHPIYIQARRVLVEPYRPEWVLHQFGIQQGILNDCRMVVRYYHSKHLLVDYEPILDWTSD